MFANACKLNNAPGNPIGNSFQPLIFNPWRQMDT